MAWGFIAGSMIFVHSAGSLYAVRLALGAAEAGYFPGALFYLSPWFRVRNGRGPSACFMERFR